MIIIIWTIKYGSTYYNTFTMGVFSNYHDYFFQCNVVNFAYIVVTRVHITIKNFSDDWRFFDDNSVDFILIQKKLQTFI